nr:hypothetical protein [Tanacetum cinerariifolium]
MLAIKIFSERKKIFRERKKCEKIHANRSYFLQGMDQYLQAGIPTVTDGGPGGPKYIKGPPVGSASLFCIFMGKVVSVFNGAFGGVEEEEVVVGESVVVTSSSLKMLTNSYLGGIMVNLIFLEGLEEEALVEFMVELFKEDDKKSKKYGLLIIRYSIKVEKHEN